MKNQQGFSIPELLVTLFIGAAFIAAGYQIYGLVIADGAQARTQAVASNLAYQTMRNSAVTQSGFCANTTSTTSPTFTITNTPKPNPGLPNPVSVTLTLSCPFFNANPVANSTITKVQVQVKYGNQGSVTHAILTTPS